MSSTDSQVCVSMGVFVWCVCWGGGVCVCVYSINTDSNLVEEPMKNVSVPSFQHKDSCRLRVSCFSSNDYFYINSPGASDLQLPANSKGGKGHLMPQLVGL